MRLWTLHPRYLDPQGLTALWREALLARAVLGGKTRGYKHHPQLDRFRRHAEPLSAIDAYLAGVFEESAARGYSFDHSKIGPVRRLARIEVTAGQVAFEWKHLVQKLMSRSPMFYERWQRVTGPESHPLFSIVPGAIESWERN